MNLQNLPPVADAASDFENGSASADVCNGQREGERLASLNNLAILDTPPEKEFDAITRLAAKAMEVPILLVSLVDESRQWFKSRVGMEATQTPREISFCTHAVQERKPLVICDTLLDTRFSNNPLVANGPRIRAYLGVPLYTRGGHAIGTLCAIDRRPRKFLAEHIETMADFAKLVEGILHAREFARETESVLKIAAQREHVFKSTFEQAAVGIAHTSLSGQILRLNGRICRMFGYTAEELQSTSFIDITHAEDIEQNVDFFRRLVAGEIENYRMEKRFLCKGGQYLWTLLSVGLVRSASGEPDFMIAVVEDISQRKLLEEELIRTRDSLQQDVQLRDRRSGDNHAALRVQIKRSLEAERVTREAQARLRTIADSVPALIGYWNRDLRCEFANRAYRHWYGIEPQRIVGMSMAELLGEKIFSLNEPHVRAVLAGHEQRFERDLTKADGSKVHVDAHYLPDFDGAAAVRGFFVLVTDITLLREAQLALETANIQLKNDSETDYLTGLYNRRVFSERSEDSLRQLKEGDKSYGLVLLDLDNFKQINDEYGHDVGDDVLRSVGRILRDSLRGLHDVAARLGGEEFAVLCFGSVDEEVLCQIAERIRFAICSEKRQTARGPLQFAGSFGVALSCEEDTDWKNIYGRADMALYEAKVAGKNRVVFGRSYLKGGTARLRALDLRRR